MRLHQLLEELPNVFQLVHRSFILRSDPNPDAKFSEYQLQHRRRAADITGLPYGLPEVGSKYPSSSLPALIASKWVERHAPDSFERFDGALFNAFFKDCRDISDPVVLASIAAACDVDMPKFLSGINDVALADAIRSEYDAALRLGITGVPAVVIGGEVITGAVSLDAYRSAARKLMSHA